MKDFFQLLVGACMVAGFIGILYGIGIALASIGAVIGFALLAIFVVGLLLYSVKELFRSLFKRKPGA